MLSTYSPPIRADELPTTRDAWHRRTGLTDPAVIAAAVRRRLAAVPGEARYADFFHRS